MAVAVWTFPVRKKLTDTFLWYWLRCSAAVACAVLSIILTLPPIVVYLRLLRPLPIPHVVLPEPNGYHDIVAAGQMVDNSAIFSNYYTSTRAQLASETRKHQAAFDRLRLGLSRPWRVPLEYSYAYDENSTDEHGYSRSLARALAGAGRLAELDERWNAASRYYLDTIRVGHVVSQGGIILDLFFGSAINGIGTAPLYHLIGHLSPLECRQTMAALCKVDQEREPFKECAHRDQIWGQNVFGWEGHLFAILEESRNIRLYTHNYTRDVAVTRLLITELAIHAFRQETGQLPKSLKELVPGYLKQLPDDPFDPKQRTLRYLATANGHLLYSVGQDGTDQGGVPPTGFHNWLGEGDLSLDVYFADDQ